MLVVILRIPMRNVSNFSRADADDVLKRTGDIEWITIMVINSMTFPVYFCIYHCTSKMTESYEPKTIILRCP